VSIITAERTPGLAVFTVCTGDYHVEGVPAEKRVGPTSKQCSWVGTMASEEIAHHMKV
jgi:hypothetical protein